VPGTQLSEIRNVDNRFRVCRIKGAGCNASPHGGYDQRVTGLNAIRSYELALLPLPAESNQALIV
jgi:hypothetical protein